MHRRHPRIRVRVREVGRHARRYNRWYLSVRRQGSARMYGAGRGMHRNFSARYNSITNILPRAAARGLLFYAIFGLPPLFCSSPYAVYVVCVESETSILARERNHRFHSIICDHNNLPKQLCHQGKALLFYTDVAITE